MARAMRKSARAMWGRGETGLSPIPLSHFTGCALPAHATLGNLRRHPPPCEKTARRFLFRARDCQSFAFVHMRIACVPQVAGRFCAIAHGRLRPCARAESWLGGHSPICPRFGGWERAVSRPCSHQAVPARIIRDSAATQRGPPKRHARGKNGHPSPFQIGS